MTRNGKVARLPKCVRDELNERLRDGEPGTGLVKWLNNDARVNEVLVKLFHGREISPQNLSEWRQGGYQDWLRHQESCERVRFLSEQADELHEAADGLCISERLATVLAVDMAETARTLLSEAKDTKERWKHLRELMQEVARLRRGDQRQGRLRMAEQKWEIEVRRSLREEQERLSREAREAAMRPFYRELGQLIKASTLGAWRAAAKDLKDQGESEWIKPDQTENECVEGRETSVDGQHAQSESANGGVGETGRRDAEGKTIRDAGCKMQDKEGNGEEDALEDVPCVPPEEESEDRRASLAALREKAEVMMAEYGVGLDGMPLQHTEKGESNADCGTRNGESGTNEQQRLKDAKTVNHGCTQMDTDVGGEAARSESTPYLSGGEDAEAQNPNPKPQDPNEGGKGESGTPRRRMGPGAWTETTYYW